ncbi:hypothetical protein BJ980_001628 [Nocardioides daedukensis]|uniref:Uncharacterized protein n=1 Tax=Nocardioides daedukensis TaxID=634462 RepID=A0A7Y9RYQ8_9ACTN|nr:hypothetical protein [Nocardioides daedukensis]NYG58705.1 hypothetical protein [Nocardioides daedukensis]
MTAQHAHASGTSLAALVQPQRPHSNHDVWAAALDELEQAVERIVAWLASDDLSDGMEAIILATSTWSVPDLPGQIPTALVPRAQSIAVRQGVVRRELAEHVSTNRGHARLTRQVDAATARPVAPAYLDLRV